ncbi:hypothetical protein COPCOM_00103 [Coprococcus comes ATCC 27758]|uniref:Uncharacterized protein n=1 Tax=Coprococcus comes ATCC 27758 TaxID=470146 RepID=C0B4P2_9FIRM|nr:hypothetical protein COPCOM_00103 [Coprococcus comes ATCC 27758]
MWNGLYSAMIPTIFILLTKISFVLFVKRLYYKKSFCAKNIVLENIT